LGSYSDYLDTDIRNYGRSGKKSDFDKYSRRRKPKKPNNDPDNNPDTGDDIDKAKRGKDIIDSIKDALEPSEDSKDDE